MKGYARKNKRMQLNCKYHWSGMAKTNTRKHNKRGRMFVERNPDTDDEYEGKTFAPVKVPPVCKLY
jgi:hypothetical protein